VQWRSRLIAPVLAVFAGAVAHAQPRETLHEFVPDVRADEAVSLSAPGEVEPTAILYDGELIPAPGDGALADDERPMTAIAGDGVGPDEAGRRSPTFRPDRMTSLEGTLGYYSVFSPTIAPFKRVTALDGVLLDGGVPVLSVYDDSRRPVSVLTHDAPPPDDRPRDRFWGSVVLDFTNGREVPLPSVSPESRILTMRTHPYTELELRKDAADNFFAFAPGRLTANQVRVTFLTDAPREYFNAEVLPEVRADFLAAEARPLPPGLQERAEGFARELGLDRSDSVADAVRTLTRHYREFEESEQPPEDSGDIYLDLSRGKRGICRHRAYGFVITALALGIPARFVMNEAHAWVEVKMRDVGWMRIDLGGAANGLEAQNADDRPRYRPAFGDPLPRPQAYEASYSQLPPGQVSGMRPSGGGGGSSSSSSSSSSSTSAGDAASSESTTTYTSATASDRSRLVLSVDRSEYQVYRGRGFDVSGRATGGSGAAAPGLRIEVLLAGPDEQHLLGVTVTRADGYYTGHFGIPPKIAVGEYDLIVRSPGDDDFLAATAR
jgi:transglutaminase-like putative cysteine protease